MYTDIFKNVNVDLAECHSALEHAAAVTHRPVKIDLVNRRI